MENNTTIGQFLATQRKRKNLSIEDVVQKTKINSKVLHHLEEDSLDKLPNKTYVRGFVTNYAKTVGLDPKLARKILANTYKEKLGEDQEEDSTEQSDQNVQQQLFEDRKVMQMRETLISIVHSLFNKKILIGAVSLIIVVSIVKGIISFFTQISSETKSIVSQDQIKKQIEVESQIKPASEDLFDSKVAKRLAIELINSQATIKDNVDSTQAEEKDEVEDKEESVVQKRIDGKFPYKEFYPSPTDMYELKTDVPEVKDGKYLPENIKNSMLSEKQNVYINATEGDTWISYKIDDQKIKRYILKKGRSVFLKGDRILLFMGNFNAAKIFLNNKLVTAQTRTGVKSMIFPEEEAKNFELPLFPSFNGIPYSAKEYKANMAARDVETN